MVRFLLQSKKKMEKEVRLVRRASLLLIMSLVAFLGQSVMISAASAHTSALLTKQLAQAAQSCPQPPQNVDLMTLSDAQLEYYGLPTHDILNQDPQGWSALLAHAKHRACGSTPDPQKKIHLPPARQHGTGNTGYTAPTWAGNVAYGSRGTYREAVVDFYVPTVVWNGSIDAELSIWAGVGGDTGQTSPAKVVQAGIETQYAPGIGQYNVGWWEVYPGYSQQNFLGGLNHGDHIHVFVSSNVNNDGYDYFYVQDITQNYYNSYKDTASQDFSDSATGECIVERPSDDNHQPYPLAEFNPPGHTEQLSSCEIANSTGTYKPIGNWPVYYYTMVNGNDTLAYPGPITNGGLNYPVYWVAST
jgi:hypothetical protein